MNSKLELILKTNIVAATLKVSNVIKDMENLRGFTIRFSEEEKRDENQRIAYASYDRNWDCMTIYSNSIINEVTSLVESGECQTIREALMESVVKHVSHELQHCFQQDVYDRDFLTLETFREYEDRITERQAFDYSEEILNKHRNKIIDFTSDLTDILNLINNRE